MAAPSVIATDYAEITAVGASVTCTFSNITPAAGDLLLAILNVDAGTSTGNIPSGWTSVGWTSITNTAVGVFYKISDGSETSVTITQGGVNRHMQLRVMQIRGINSSAPINANTTTTAGSGGAYSTPSVTTTVPDCLCIGISAAAAGTGTASDIPAGTTLIGWNIEAGNNCTLAVASFEQVLAGTTGTKSWGNASQAKRVGTIAIAPAAAPVDETAPELGSPTVTPVGDGNTAELSVTTDEDNGTLRAVITTSATPPSNTQVVAGQDHTGAAALLAASQAVTTAGAQVMTRAIPFGGGLYAHFCHSDGAGNHSDVVTAGPFDTAFHQIFFDDFNRADGGLGNNWAAVYGTPAISANRAVKGTPDGNGDSGALVSSEALVSVPAAYSVELDTSAVLDPLDGDSVSASFGVGSPGEFSGLVVFFGGDYAALWLYDDVNGVYTSLDTTSLTTEQAAGRARVDISHNGSASIRVYSMADGLLLMDAVVASENIPAHVTEFRPGIDFHQVNDAGLLWIDNFAVFAEYAPPVLSLHTAYSSTTSTAFGTVTTDVAAGTLFTIASTSVTKPTQLQVAGGLDHTGSAAVGAASWAVTDAGELDVAVSGLPQGATLYLHSVHRVGSVYSNVATSPAVKTRGIGLVDGDDQVAEGQTDVVITGRFGAAEPVVRIRSGAASVEQAVSAYDAETITLDEITRGNLPYTDSNHTHIIEVDTDE